MENILDYRAKALAMLACCAAVSVLVACTGVDYGYIDYGDGADAPGHTDVLFSFDWGNLPTGEIPQACSIAMSRIVNEVHYTYVVDSQGNIMEGNEDESVEDDMQGRRPVSVLDGDYYAIAFGSAENGYTVNDLDVFRDDNSSGMKNLYASLPVLTKDDVAEQLGEEPVDFNPSYKAVPAAAPLYLSVRKMTLNSGEKASEVTFVPQDITVDLVIRVRIDVEEGVGIGGLLAELSGVPVKVPLMSGIVTGDDLGKVYFRMEQLASDGQGIVFEGRVKALGLFTSQSASLVSGPGVLRLSVHAVSGENERKFYAGINLKRVIDEARLMVRTEDGTGYRIAMGEAVLDVDRALTIKNGQVVSGGDDAMDGWFDTKTDIEVEV